MALNADISITVTAMTLKFHDFSYRNTLSVWAEKMVKKYLVKKKLQSIAEHLLTLNFDKNKK